MAFPIVIGINFNICDIPCSFIIILHQTVVLYHAWWWLSDNNNNNNNRGLTYLESQSLL